MKQVELPTDMSYKSRMTDTLHVYRDYLVETAIKLKDKNIIVKGQ